MSSKPLNQPLLLKIILSIFCHQRLYKRWSLCWKIFLGHSSCRIQKLLQTSPALQLKNRTRWRLRLFLKHGKPETNQTHLFNFLGCFHVTHPEVFSAKPRPSKGYLQPQKCFCRILFQPARSWGVNSLTVSASLFSTSMAGSSRVFFSGMKNRSMQFIINP